MKLSRTGASRAALFVACSITAIALSSPACASGAANPTSTVEPVETLDIVTNNGPAITPGPGSVATGANYANSPDVLSLGVNGVGQMISITLRWNFAIGVLSLIARSASVETSGCVR